MIQIDAITGACQLTFHRVVESQETVATMQIVDTLFEQSLLESILEDSKPAYPKSHANTERHYLLKTPFRYPPLPHGSRFASRYEPAIFYASYCLSAALTESAFYSFYFMSRSKSPFKGTINNKKTSFEARVNTECHADLCAITDQQSQESLQHVCDYTYSQAVGAHMRENKIEAFSYFSARQRGDKHLGIFYLDAIQGEPSNICQWHIKQTEQRIIYYCASDKTKSMEFCKQSFCTDGELLHPS